MFLTILVLGPVQEPQGQVKGVGSTFLHCGAGVAIQIHQPGFQFFVIHADKDLLALECIQGMLTADIFPVSPFMNGLTARI